MGSPAYCMVKAILEMYRKSWASPQNSSPKLAACGRVLRVCWFMQSWSSCCNSFPSLQRPTEHFVNPLGLRTIQELQRQTRQRLLDSDMNSLLQQTSPGYPCVGVSTRGEAYGETSVSNSVSRRSCWSTSIRIQVPGFYACHCQDRIPRSSSCLWNPGHTRCCCSVFIRWR